MKIESNPKKAATNLKKHSVSFEEAQTCLLDPHTLVREDPDAKGEAGLGMSSKARFLVDDHPMPCPTRIQFD